MRPYFEQDGITIYHGDALEVLPHVDVADLVVTDPPYFQPATHYVPARAAKPIRSLGDTSVLEYVFGAWASALDRQTAPCAPLYLFCDGQSYPLLFRAFYSLGKVRPLVWDKLTSFNGYTWRHQYELIAWIEPHDAKRIPTGDGDVLRERAVKQADRLHPAEKPVPLLSRLIAKHPGETILDPFMGSGTALLAARDLGRQAIGIEIEERYCEIAAKRLQQAPLALAV